MLNGDDVDLESSQILNQEEQNRSQNFIHNEYCSIYRNKIGQALKLNAESFVAPSLFIEYSKTHSKIQFVFCILWLSEPKLICSKHNYFVLFQAYTQ